MDYESFLKGGALAFVIAGALAHCSYSADLRGLKNDNVTLIDQNIILQKRLVESSAKEPSSAPVVSADPEQDPLDDFFREGRQVISDQLYIHVSPADDGKYCTFIKFDERTLLDECRARQSRFSLLHSPGYDRPVFREEWRQTSKESGSSSGVIIWSIHDHELVQHVNLLTERRLPACDLGGKQEVCYQYERWLKASLYVSEEERPVVQYRYLTNAGDAGEVRYTWSDEGFRLTGKDVPAGVMDEYGL